MSITQISRTFGITTRYHFANSFLPLTHGVDSYISETFVNGNVHTMGVENMWSLFKWAIIGVYHRVSSKYLQAYLDEFAFRFNNRDNEAIFEMVLANCTA